MDDEIMIQEYSPLNQHCRKEFNTNGKKYRADIFPYQSLSEDGIIDYKVIDHEFVVNLYSEDGAQTVKIYRNAGVLRQTGIGEITLDRSMLELLDLIIELEYGMDI